MDKVYRLLRNLPITLGEFLSKKQFSNLAICAAIRDIKNDSHLCKSAVIFGCLFLITLPMAFSGAWALHDGIHSYS
jgi:hypothetical protein